MAISRAKSERTWRASSLPLLRRSWRSARGMPRSDRRARRRRARRRRAGLAGARDARRRYSLSRAPWLEERMEADQGAAGPRRRHVDPARADHAHGAYNPFRDRSVYNAGTDNFSGRTIAAEIDPLRGRRLPALDCQRERRRLDDRRCPGGGAGMVSLSPTRSITTTSRRSRSIRTIRRPTRSGRHGRAERVRQRLRGGRRPVSCRPTAARRGRARSASLSSPAAPSGRSRSSRATRTRSSWPRDAG